MNQGIYGMTDGRGVAGRKLAFKPGPTAGAALQPVMGLAQSGVGALVSAVSLSGTRTRYWSCAGRGAIRVACYAETGNVTSALTAELVVDGVTVVTANVTTFPGNGYGFSLVGASAYTTSYSVPTIAFDYIPFDSSAEIYITRPGGGGGNLAVVCDIHQ